MFSVELGIERVQRFATIWTVRESNHRAARFSAPVPAGLEAKPPYCTVGKGNKAVRAWPWLPTPAYS